MWQRWSPRPCGPRARASQRRLKPPARCPGLDKPNASSGTQIIQSRVALAEILYAQPVAPIGGSGIVKPRPALTVERDLAA